MSELKAYTYDDMIDGDADTNIEYYPKSEADKVIAEKDNVITYARALVREDIKIIFHHKYKRCLAMARGCRLRARWFGDNAFYKKEQWALQWRKRWLELAERFKEAK